jgi:hypothetical protein
MKEARGKLFTTAVIPSVVIRWAEIIPETKAKANSRIKGA